VVDDASVGVSQLEVLARAEDHEIMAFQHKSAPIFGVQFHPESVLTPKGQELINNWLSLVRMASASKSSSL
jgi:anthranilate/para-aminobenzoate synthase component II